jgi:hypothetical protein
MKQLSKILALAAVLAMPAVGLADGTDQKVPVQKPVVEPIKKPEPVQKPVVEPIQKPEEKPAVEPVQKPEEKPVVVEPVQKPEEKPVVVVEPVQKPEEKPVVVEPVQKPEQKPVVEPIQNPLIKQESYAIECSRSGLWMSAAHIAEKLEEAYDELEDASESCSEVKAYALAGEEKSKELRKYMKRSCSSGAHGSIENFKSHYAGMLSNQMLLSQENLRSGENYREFRTVNELFDRLTDLYERMIGEQ